MDVDMNQAAPDPPLSIPFIGDITDPSIAAAPADGVAPVVLLPSRRKR